MSPAAPAYGLWILVIINSLVFIVFALSFATPRSARDWRSFGAFSGFIVALFAEMYGYPLTIYLLSGWLATRFPGVDFLSHDAGHLLELMFGSRANPHFGPFHLLSYAFVFGGFWLLAAAWPVLYRHQRQGTLATTGPYARIRHPQYVGFVMIMFGFLLQWPTIVTLAMFPVLCFMYVRLALSEEKEAQRVFGAQWSTYAGRTPRFIPRFAGVGCVLCLLAAALMLAAVPPAALAQADPAATAAQLSSDGGVTVKVTPKTIGPADGRWEFSVVLDTHSADLSDDLTQIATLATDDGRTLQPSNWTGAGPGGHHREGVLSFDIAAPRPAAIELRITRPGEAAPRTFKWKF